MSRSKLVDDEHDLGILFLEHLEGARSQHGFGNINRGPQFFFKLEILTRKIWRCEQIARFDNAEHGVETVLADGKSGIRAFRNLAANFFL